MSVRGAGVPLSQMLKMIEDYLGKSEGIKTKALKKARKGPKRWPKSRPTPEIRGERRRYKAERCGFNKNRVCIYWTWEKQPPAELDSIPVMTKEGKFHIHASPLNCAFCTHSRPELGEHVNEKISNVPSRLEVNGALRKIGEVMRKLHF